MALAAALFAIPAAKPLLLDNMDFPAVAKATAETGIPVYYRGEDNPRHSGLYHPPLYIYLLAGWFRLFNFGEVQARLFGFFCALAHGALVLRLVRLLLGATLAARSSPWFWLFFLCNPYTLQGAAIADIDTTIYGPLLLALIAAAWQTATAGSVLPPPGLALPAGSVLAAVTALALWAKLTTVLSVLPLAVLLAAIRCGWKCALVKAGGAIAAGIGLFLATYGAYGWVTGQDILYTFRFTLGSFTQRSGPVTGMAWLASRWRTFADMAGWQVAWTGLLPWAIGAAAAVWIIRRSWSGREARRLAAGAVLAWALFVAGFYCSLLYTFGRAPFKYVFVSWGIVCASAALWQAAAWQRLSRRGTAAAALAGGLALATFLVSARLLRDRWILEGQMGKAELALALIPALGALAGLALWNRRAGPWLYCGSAMVWAGAMAGLALSMARAPYATTYYYGQQGFEDTVCFLRMNTAPQEAILSMKDVGFAAGRRYFENYGYVNTGAAGAEAVSRILGAGRVRYAVFTEGIGADQLMINPQLDALIHNRCRLARSFGHYRIWDCSAASASPVNGRDGPSGR